MELGLGPKMRLVYRRVPCVPRSRAREKISADGTEKVADVQKNCVWYMYNVTLETTYIHPGTNFRADLVQNMP